jgi:hypothetical protein
MSDRRELGKASITASSLLSYLGTFPAFCVIEETSIGIVFLPSIQKQGFFLEQRVGRESWLQISSITPRQKAWGSSERQVSDIPWLSMNLEA